MPNKIIKSEKTISPNKEQLNAIVICPYLSTYQTMAKPVASRSSSSRLDEAIGLAEAISLNVVFSKAFNLNRINPATFIGSGLVESISGISKSLDVTLAIMDCQLSPMQQRNLEKAWQIKVIDRTALILEIFGERANTREGVLQVELAHLTYQKSRLVKSWTHLERQRGGAGFLGGPGEKQIEMDRRIIGEKIIKLNQELETVKRTRCLHRKARQSVPYPVIALVGYTNAGKSTLFNRLTGASVFAKDQLFATLDTTMRQITLPKGTKAILSDTVGFISDLPTELIAAFRATLEEVLEADIIIHVRDIVNDDTIAQKNDVLNVLKSLGIGDKIDSVIEVQNKIDALSPDERQALQTINSRKDKIVAVSAYSGEGTNLLLDLIETELDKGKETVSVFIDSSNGALIAWLYRNSEIIKRVDGDDTQILFTVKITPTNLARLKTLEAKDNNGTDI